MQSTDTIVPKEEIRLLLRQRPFVHLTVCDPNPLLSTIAQQHISPNNTNTTSAIAGDAGEGGSAPEKDPLSSVSDGASGGEAAVSTSSSLLLSMLSWTLGNGREQLQAEHELSEEQKQLRRLSRQRTHVHGQSTERARFGAVLQGA